LDYGQRFRHWTYVNYNYLIQNLDTIAKEMRETLFSLSDERETPNLQSANFRGIQYEFCKPAQSTFALLQHPKMKELFLKHTQGLSPADDPNVPRVHRTANPILPTLALTEAGFSQLNFYMVTHNCHRFVKEFEAMHRDFLVKALQNAVANIDNQLVNECDDDQANIIFELHLASPAYRIQDDKIAEFHPVFMTDNQLYIMSGFNRYVQFNSEVVQCGSMTVDTPLMVQ
jgi:hypothetical protein